MSDGIFKWRFAAFEDSEYWSGSYETREAAIAAGLAAFGAGESYWICEADKAEYNFSGLFGTDHDDELSAGELTIDLVYIDEVLTRWSENEEAISDDGWENDSLDERDKALLVEALIEAQATPSPDPDRTSPRAEAMSKAFEEWAERHRSAFGVVYMFGQVRVSEKIAATDEAANA